MVNCDVCNKKEYERSLFFRLKKYFVCLVCDDLKDGEIIEKMDKAQRSKIIEQNFDIFNGNCPTCNDDDLELVEGCLEYQELECSNNHIFEISSLGWEITKIKKGVNNE